MSDRALFRAGVRTLLPHDEFAIVSEAANVRDAIDSVALHRPDALLLDIALGERATGALCGALLERAPAIPLLVMFGSEEEHVARAAVEAGARAAIWRDAESLDLRRAVERVIEGELVLDGLAPDTRSGERRDAPELPRLSERERDVLQLAARGMTNAEIGAELSLSMNTVKEYLSNAMRKLEVTNRVDAVREATRRGLLDEPSPIPEEVAAPEPHELRTPSPLEVIRDLSRIDIEDPDIQVPPLKIRSLQAGSGPHLPPHPTLRDLGERASQP